MVCSAQHRSDALPNLGDGEGMSLSAESTLGRQIMQQIYRDPDYLDDPVLQDYLYGIWQRLLQAARARGDITPDMDERFPWAPFLVRDPEVNAFALPGGYLGVNLGLIALVNSPHELASVLGHEMSHISQRHIARSMATQKRQTPLLLAAMLLGMMALSKNPDAGSAAIVGGQAAAQQSQLNYSRDMEREADRMGFAEMVAAGFDPRGFVSMFNKLQQANHLNDNDAFPYLRTHPLTGERIADAQLRTNQALANERAAQSAVSGATGQAETNNVLASVASLPANMNALLMAARAKVLANPGSGVLQTWVSAAQTELQKPLPLGDDALAHRAAIVYTGVLAQIKLHSMASTQTMLAELTRLSQGDVAAAHSARLLAAEVALAQDQPRAALAQLQAPDASRAALLIGAQARLQAADAQDLHQAEQDLQLWLTGHEKDATAWQSLSAIYVAQNRKLPSIRAEAEAHAAQFDYEGARDRLRSAQDFIRQQGAGAALDTADNIEAAIIDSRAREVQAQLRQQALER